MAAEAELSALSEPPPQVDVIKVPLDDGEEDLLVPVGAYVTNEGRPRGDPAIYRWSMTDIAYWPPYGDGEVVGVTTKTQCQRRPEVGKYHHWSWVEGKEYAVLVSLPRFEAWCRRCKHKKALPERCHATCCAKYWKEADEKMVRRAIEASLEGNQEGGDGGPDDDEVKELGDIEGYVSSPPSPERSLAEPERGELAELPGGDNRCDDEDEGEDDIPSDGSMAELLGTGRHAEPPGALSSGEQVEEDAEDAVQASELEPDHSPQLPDRSMSQGIRDSAWLDEGGRRPRDTMAAQWARSAPPSEGDILRHIWSSDEDDDPGLGGDGGPGLGEGDGPGSDEVGMLGGDDGNGSGSDTQPLLTDTEEETDDEPVTPAGP
jgi:hypothetical protein